MNTRTFGFIMAMMLCAVLSKQEVFASTSNPGNGTVVHPARATWNTGFFQEALVRRGLMELGFDVKKPKDLSNPIFYNALALGDVDYWTNGWFPMHNAQLPKGFDEVAEKVGYVLKSGGLHGYLVSKKEAEKFHIVSLDDFKREEVKKAFDKNGDGKADLTGCSPGWGCEKVTTYHMKEYDLTSHINVRSAAYEASMASTIAEFKNNEPIFFVTWIPNWTVAKLRPGKDVVWINVPSIKPTDAQKASEDKMTTSGLVGAVSDPLRLGFVVSDIRIVANKRFLKKNPSAKRFFEVFTLKLESVSRQNAKMNDGEKSEADIARHVDQWIHENQTTWNDWIEYARQD